MNFLIPFCISGKALSCSSSVTCHETNTGSLEPCPGWASHNLIPHSHDLAIDKVIQPSQNLSKCKFNLILQRMYHNYEFPWTANTVIRSSCCDANDKRWIRVCRDWRIECPIKASNCPTNVSFNNISQLILLTDGLIAPKINLCDKSSHSCLVWAIRQSYFGGYEWNSIWGGGRLVHTNSLSALQLQGDRWQIKLKSLPAWEAQV